MHDAKEGGMSWKDLVVLIAVFAGILFGVSSCQNSEWYKRDQREQAESERREKTPHVIREADGCKVYTFKSGDRYHYFTRCNNSKTSTESSWEECRQAGKTRTCETKTETID